MSDPPLLFNPDRPAEPHPALMPTYIDIFVANFRSRFPFLDYEALVAAYLKSTLSPALANAVASLTIPCVPSIVAPCI
jgi:hypothetical protein